MGKESLLTTSNHAPAMELICLYHERWEEDRSMTSKRPIKIHVGRPSPLTSGARHPRGWNRRSTHCRWPTSSCVRMLEAAKQENQDADRLSFTGCFQILQGRLPECQSSTPTELEQWYRLLLEEMAQERTEPRRNRINPPVVSKMSKFAKKRPATIAANRRLRKPLLSQWLSLDERYWALAPMVIRGCPRIASVYLKWAVWREFSGHKARLSHLA